MADRITIRINGRTLSVTPGTSILDAARRNGIDIPTLCYMEAFPTSACAGSVR